MADDPDAARPRPARRGRRGSDDDVAPDAADVTEALDEPAPEPGSEPEPEPEPEDAPSADEPEPEPETEPEPEAAPNADEPAPDEPAVAAESEQDPEGDSASTEAAQGDPDEEPLAVAAAAVATANEPDLTATSLWDTSDGMPTASLPWLQARSPDDRICPFLRAVAADDHLGFPVESPDAANRCASMREAVPQSLRQQELVCLTANHVNCPRYLRGSASSVAATTEAVTPRVRQKAVMTPAISAALIILALSFGASVAFGLANGGLALPSKAAVVPPSPSASSVAVGPRISPSPAATASSSLAPAASASAAPSASASAAASPATSASPSPSASPSTAPAPSASAVAGGPTSSPVSSRTKLLKPCPNKPDCWIYTVRAGDNLFSIAKYFGVPLTTVRKLNPWTRTESLRAGKKLILPNPTR